MKQKIRSFCGRLGLFAAALRRMAAVCLLVGLALLLGAVRGRLTLRTDQQAAARWSDDDVRFSQVSAFFGEKDALSLDAVYAARTKTESTLTEASIIANDGARLWLDAFGAEYSSSVSSERAAAKVTVSAVDGDYFYFHPFLLLSGAYFSSEDEQTDVVVLDETAAWQLFGSPDVVGRTVTLDGKLLTVCGVIRAERDEATTLTYGSLPRVFVCYRYMHTSDEACITWYEAVMPDSYTGYGLATLQDSLGTKDRECTVVENSARFSFSSLWRTFRQRDRALMRADAVSYPFWENAALYTQTRASTLLAAQLACLLYPAALLLVLLIRAFIRRKWHLSDIRKWVERRVDRRNQKLWEKTATLDPLAADAPAVPCEPSPYEQQEE